MSIETEVQALTQATTDLLQAVNVRKTALDAAVDQAQSAAAEAQESAGYLSSASTVSATGQVTLAADSPAYQFINPNGANRSVVLPALSAQEAGRPFIVKNTGVNQGLLSVMSGAAQIGPFISGGFTLSVVWTGTVWEPI